MSHERLSKLPEVEHEKSHFIKAPLILNRFNALVGNRDSLNEILDHVQANQTAFGNYTIIRTNGKRTYSGNEYPNLGFYIRLNGFPIAAYRKFVIPQSKWYPVESYYVFGQTDNQEQVSAGYTLLHDSTRLGIYNYAYHFDSGSSAVSFLLAQQPNPFDYNAQRTLAQTLGIPIQ